VKVVTAEQMRYIDHLTINEIGIPSMVLMERAGLSVVNQIKCRYQPEEKDVVVLAGTGNNGGDGMVVARELHRHGYRVQLILCGKVEKLSKDAKLQYEICQKMRVPTKITFSLKPSMLKNAIIVDAIIGTGLSKNLREDILKVVETVNNSEGMVFAIDIPTGVSSDTGQLMPEAIKADITVTFGLPKVGHLLYPGKSYTGALIVEDIGFPKELLNSEDIKLHLVQPEDIRALLPHRPEDAYKGVFGHVVVIGGSLGKTGALKMAANAVLRAGAGLVTIVAEKDVIAQISILEEMSLPIDGFDSSSLEKVVQFIHEKADTVAIGPGLGREKKRLEFVLALLQQCSVPTVVDADGLFALASLGSERIFKFLDKLTCPVILTPHAMEMARLIGKTPQFVNEKRIELAQQFSIQTGACLVLKGPPTVIASEGNIFLNPTGNNGMATAGSGDVLTGIIAGVLAQGLPPLEASVVGTYLHGLAGDLGVKDKTPYALTASDLIEYLPKAYSQLL